MSRVDSARRRIRSSVEDTESGYDLIREALAVGDKKLQYLRNQTTSGKLRESVRIRNEQPTSEQLFANARPIHTENLDFAATDAILNDDMAFVKKKAAKVETTYAGEISKNKEPRPMNFGSINDTGVLVAAYASRSSRRVSSLLNHFGIEPPVPSYDYYGSAYIDSQRYASTIDTSTRTMARPLGSFWTLDGKLTEPISVPPLKPVVVHDVGEHLGGLEAICAAAAPIIQDQHLQNEQLQKRLVGVDVEELASINPITKEMRKTNLTGGSAEKSERQNTLSPESSIASVRSGISFQPQIDTGIQTIEPEVSRSMSKRSLTMHNQVLANSALANQKLAKLRTSLQSVGTSASARVLSDLPPAPVHAQSRSLNSEGSSLNLLAASSPGVASSTNAGPSSEFASGVNSGVNSGASTPSRSMSIISDAPLLAAAPSRSASARRGSLLSVFHAINNPKSPDASKSVIPPRSPANSAAGTGASALTSPGAAISTAVPQLDVTSPDTFGSSLHPIRSRSRRNSAASLSGATGAGGDSPRGLQYTTPADARPGSALARVAMVASLTPPGTPIELTTVDARNNMNLDLAGYGANSSGLEEASNSKKLRLGLLKQGNIVHSILANLEKEEKKLTKKTPKIYVSKPSSIFTPEAGSRPSQKPEIRIGDEGAMLPEEGKDSEPVVDAKTQGIARGRRTSIVGKLGDAEPVRVFGEEYTAAIDEAKEAEKKRIEKEKAEQEAALYATISASRRSAAGIPQEVPVLAGMSVFGNAVYKVVTVRPIETGRNFASGLNTSKDKKVNEDDVPEVDLKKEVASVRDLAYSSVGLPQPRKHNVEEAIDPHFVRERKIKMTQEALEELDLDEETRRKLACEAKIIDEGLLRTVVATGAFSKVLQPALQRHRPQEIQETSEIGEAFTSRLAQYRKTNSARPSSGSTDTLRRMDRSTARRPNTAAPGATMRGTAATASNTLQHASARPGAANAQEGTVISETKEMETKTLPRSILRPARKDGNASVGTSLGRSANGVRAGALLRPSTAPVASGRETVSSASDVRQLTGATKANAEPAKTVGGGVRVSPRKSASGKKQSADNAGEKTQAKDAFDDSMKKYVTRDDSAEELDWEKVLDAQPFEDGDGDTYSEASFMSGIYQLSTIIDEARVKKLAARRERKKNPYLIRPHVLHNQEPIEVSITKDGDLKIGDTVLTLQQVKELVELKKADPALLTTYIGVIKHTKLRAMQMSELKDEFRATATRQSAKLSASLAQLATAMSFRHDQRVKALNEIIDGEGNKITSATTVLGASSPTGSPTTSHIQQFQHRDYNAVRPSTAPVRSAYNASHSGQVSGQVSGQTTPRRNPFVLPHQESGGSMAPSPVSESSAAGVIDARGVLVTDSISHTRALANTSNSTTATATATTITRTPKVGARPQTSYSAAHQSVKLNIHTRPSTAGPSSSTARFAATRTIGAGCAANSGYLSYAGTGMAHGANQDGSLSPGDSPSATLRRSFVVPAENPSLNSLTAARAAVAPPSNSLHSMRLLSAKVSTGAVHDTQILFEDVINIVVAGSPSGLSPFHSILVSLLESTLASRVHVDAAWAPLFLEALHDRCMSIPDSQLPQESSRPWAKEKLIEPPAFLQYKFFLPGEDDTDAPYEAEFIDIETGNTNSTEVVKNLFDTFGAASSHPSAGTMKRPRWFPKKLRPVDRLYFACRAEWPLYLQAPLTHLWTGLGLKTHEFDRWLVQHGLSPIPETAIRAYNVYLDMRKQVEIRKALEEARHNIKRS